MAVVKLNHQLEKIFQKHKPIKHCYWDFSHLRPDSALKITVELFKVACRVRVAYWKEQNHQFFIKLIFCGKKWSSNQWFCSPKKSSKSLKNFFLSKKNSSSLFMQIWSSKRCAKTFLNKWVSRYLRFDDFEVPKNCSSH